MAGDDQSKHPGDRPIQPNSAQFLNMKHSQNERQTRTLPNVEPPSGNPVGDGLPENANDIMPLFFSNGVEIDQVIKTVNGFNNMALLHEIAVNEEFRFEHPKGESLRGIVRDQVFRAYWNVFELNLTKAEPDYSCAIDIVGTIKESILDLLMPHSTPTRNRINETLDLELIKQQLDKGVFGIGDFKKYAEFTITQLGALCSPSRDKKVHKIRRILEPQLGISEDSDDSSELGEDKGSAVAQPIGHENSKENIDVKNEEKTVGMPELLRAYREIMELIELMKLDMANFNLQRARPLIIQNCVQYEKETVAACIELKYRVHQDPLEYTRKWLEEAQCEGLTPQEIINKAFCRIINYDIPLLDSPETLTLDIARFMKLSFQVKRLVIIASTILAVTSSYQMKFKSLMVEASRSEMINKFLLIVDMEDVMLASKLGETMQRLFEQAILLVNSSLQAQNQPPVSAEDKKTFQNAVLDVILPDNRVRSLLLKRILEFAGGPIGANGVPPGLGDIKSELIPVISGYKQIIGHNMRVYSELYEALILGKILPPKPAHELDGDWDPSLTEAMRILRGNNQAKVEVRTPTSSSPTTNSFHNPTNLK